MSGLAPPSAGVDLAPTWLVEEGTVQTKMVHERATRVSDAQRRICNDVANGKRKDRKCSTGG